jgi:predicted RNase H-like nuclease (RuvC/YqgF family)
MKRMQQSHQNELASLKDSIGEQSERQLEDMAAEHQREVSALKDAVLKAKMDADAQLSQRNFRVAELEKEIIELNNKIFNSQRLERVAKDLELVLVNKNYELTAAEREISRLQKQNSEQVAQINKFKFSAAGTPKSEVFN